MYALDSFFSLFMYTHIKYSAACYKAHAMTIIKIVDCCFVSAPVTSCTAVDAMVLAVHAFHTCAIVGSGRMSITRVQLSQRHALPNAWARII